MLLDRKPDLFDGLANLRRLSPAALSNPLPKRPRRGRARRAFLPGRDAERDSQFARDSDEPEALRGAVDLTVGAARNLGFHELRNERAHVLAGHACWK